MYRLFLFCFLFFTAATCWAGDFQRHIRWFPEAQISGSKAKLFPDFEGSIIVDKTKIPYWFESFELTSGSAEVSIINTVFEPVQDTLINSKGLIDSELHYTFDTAGSSGKSFLRLTINPFIIQNKRIEKLVGFTVRIHENSDQLKSAKTAFPWKSGSVLATGKWSKIKTKASGMYKITYDQLKQWGFSNPDQVALYGNGGFLLPTLNKDLRFDDLSSYPVIKGKDNAGKDCLFFYSSGNIQYSQNLETGNFSHQQNYYATETYFYLTDLGNQLLINKAAEVAETAGRKVTSFPNYTFYEKEIINLIGSGNQWFGEHFVTGSSQTINLTLDNPDLSKPIQLSILAAGKSASASSMDVSLNGSPVKEIDFQPIDISDPTSDYADDRKVDFSGTIPAKNFQVKLSYNASNSSSEAWLDFIGINYQSFLNMNADVYAFRARGVDGQVTVSEIDVNGAGSTTKILNVTDIINTTEVPAIYADGQLKFKSNASYMQDYIAFNPTGTIPVPELVGAVVNQNLHAADIPEMIIVTSPILQSKANVLADFHRSSDQMNVKVVTPEVIYNEFSGGSPDPSALRNYFRMCYDRGKQSGKNTLKYILLMGDGSFDNRNLLGKNHNMIPTFQSDNSLSPTESFVTDDYFVFLDEDEGGYNGIIDLGIGRIPAQNVDEAEVAVYKIMNYQSKETMGTWRNVVTFIGDDEDNSTHMDQAEKLAQSVNKSHPAFFTDKIYFDAYKQQSTSGGEKYPDVTIAINNRVKQGTLVMNYTGHANAEFLADEKVLDISTINSWSNLKQLPIFVTATCEFSRFDADATSAGEHILFNPSGGGIGLFSTTRLVYSGANYVLNSKFYNYIFEKDQSGNNLRLGDVMRMAKAAANTGTNQLNFSLLADPAMRLADPNLQVKTTSINGNNVEIGSDTISTLSVVKVKGYVADYKGAKLTGFNGQIVPTVYDKAMQVETLGNSGQDKFSYTVQNNVIYRGLASVKNGDFEFSFFVPKDISYKLGKGKISYYAYNETVDAQGYFDNFYIGGSSNSSITDAKGPQIELFMNSESFKDGETVSASSVLLANITDDTGINTAGTGIGHDITAILDDDYSNIIVLNDYFQADLDSYLSGKIVFPLTKLTEGEHKLVVKVWDVLNNSTEKEIHFVVKDDFRIETIANYPNPMQSETRFVFTHNMPDEIFNVNLEIFQVNGSRIDQVLAKLGSQGTESLPLVWTPAERSVKMGLGVYVYRLTATANGKTSSASGRLVVVNR